PRSEESAGRAGLGKRSNIPQDRLVGGGHAGRRSPVGIDDGGALRALPVGSQRDAMMSAIASHSHLPPTGKKKEGRLAELGLGRPSCPRRPPLDEEAGPENRS